jgi:Aspartyl protease
MSIPFDPRARSILVPVMLADPRRNYLFKFALDTGATQSLLSTQCLIRLGYDLRHPAARTRIRSATGVTLVPSVRVSTLVAFGRTRTDFLLAAHDLPLGVEADGLLGLDFFRELVLTLDFARGRVSLSPARPWWRFWR